MVKKSALAVCSVALLAAAFALPASAQDARENVNKPLSAHGTFTSVTARVESKLPPTNVTIFNNFGTGTGVWVANGWLILGVTSPSFLVQQNIAQPFTTGTAAAGYHATSVEVPVQFYNLSDGGTNKFEISIETDAAGVPSGLTVAGAGPTAEVANTTFPMCCTAAEAKTAHYTTAALTASTPYWVVVDTNPAADTATEAVWSFTGKNTVNYGFCVASASPCTAWGAADALESPAAKVLGTTP